jgi:hypothetical protein
MTYTYDENDNLIETVTKNEEGTEESTEEETEEEDSDTKTVSLKKHLVLKKKLKDAKSSSSISDEDRELLNEVREERATKKLKTAYDGEFEKLSKLYPELDDKSSQIFQLARLEDNKDKTLEEIALDTFGGFIKKQSVVDESSGGGSDNDFSDIDFSKMTEAQNKAVLSNPAAKKKYYSYLDTLN